MPIKERFQNPTVHDSINLRLFTYNSHERTSVISVEKVDIYYLDPIEKSSSNPDGRRLVQTLTDITEVEDGQYSTQLDLSPPLFVIGKYIDVWTLTIDPDEPSQESTNYFEVYPNLWYTTPSPIVYDFKFHFQPNRLRKGSKQYLIVEIIPNVPRASDLERYYQNLAIAAQMYFTMEQACGDCVPSEQDLRIIFEDEPITLREKRFGYYQLDTEDLDTGVYDLTFKLDFGDNRYVSDRMQFQIFD